MLGMASFYGGVRSWWIHQLGGWLYPLNGYQGVGGLRRRKEVTLSDLGDVLRSDRPLAGIAYLFVHN